MTTGIEADVERVRRSGPAGAVEVEHVDGADTSSGASDAARGPGAYIDTSTALLGVLSAQWTDTQQMRKASLQRELPSNITEAWQVAETRTSEALKRALREHPLWPWLSDYRGMGGAHVARLMARIRDPRRFPGQQCENGHTMAPLYEVGSECPIRSVEDEGCGGLMLPPRETTGVRSLWHYCGLHVVDGRSPRKQKGQRATWDVISRTSILQPDGIADAIIKNRTPHYRDVYDIAKARLARERGIVVADEIESETGPEGVDESGRVDGADRTAETAGDDGLRPIQIHERARKIAVKEFVADLLMQWKRIAKSGESA